MQKGSDIDGEAADDHSGESVSMPDAHTVAIGAYWNDENGKNAGHVRVYGFNLTALQPLGTKKELINVYPNPSTGKFTVKYNGQQQLSYEVKDIAGKLITRGTLEEKRKKIDLSDKPAGTYILEFSFGSQVIDTQKIIKE